jgi:glutaredoxin
VTFALFALCLAAADPLQQAKDHLSAGKLDDVLFVVQDAKLKGDAAADVLAEAGRQALEKKDDVLALQFVQMALRAKAKHPLALEVGARSSLAQSQFDPAESYGDQWVAVEPKNARARLLRAEVAIAEAEWAQVIASLKAVDPAQLSTTDRARMQQLVEKASAELRDKKQAAAKSRELEKTLESTVEQLKKAQAREKKSGVATVSGAGSAKVIIYGTSWCGYCKQAARWMKAKGVDFVEKDIEKDATANNELEEKKRAAHRSEGGVPWIDVRGQLVHGFDQQALEQLL